MSGRRSRNAPTAAIWARSEMNAKADGSTVRARGWPGVSIVDARSASLYDGVTTGGMADHKHKTGHIASAKSVPFSE